MEKRYQIFVSSTYEDLINERKAITQALLECKCFPSGMELFPASNQKSWDIIKKVINDSDYYLLVIAGRYGSTIKENGKHIGYTEKEYNYALQIKKPIIAFINDDIENMRSKNVEQTQAGKTRLDKFKKRVKNSNIQVAFWKDTGELVSKIKSSIQELINSTPSTGWIKGDINYNENSIVYKDWGLEKIFKTRAEKNIESDPKLEGHKVKQLDGIAFGLSSFRSNREKDILLCLKNGMNMRLLVMNPNSEFVLQRAIEEKEHKDSIATSIRKLVEWVEKLNQLSDNGKIQIKYYNAMTLDFYWRIDDELYIGPYMYNVVSQQTVTYKFIKGGRGFNLYTDYFESLWNNKDLCQNP